jgi:hypothetical protein
MVVNQHPRRHLQDGEHVVPMILLFEDRFVDKSLRKPVGKKLIYLLGNLDAELCGSRPHHIVC